MTDVTFLGDINGEHVVNTIELGQIQTAMELILAGEDHVFDRFVAKLSNSQQVLLDAMSWEQDKTIKSYINALQNFGRFAIHGKDTVLGVSSRDAEDAAEALRKGEF